MHKLSDFRGQRVMLSFFRPVSCPICLYNVDRLKQQTDFLNEAGIATISIFASEPKNITKFAKSNMSTGMLVLSDMDRKVYTSFQVKRMKLPVGVATHLREASKKKYQNFVPSNELTRSDMDQRKKGFQRGLLLPADFLIDVDGIIVDLFRAKRTSDFMAIDRIEAFIPEDKRCKCQRKDCVFPRCRQKYEEIMEDAKQGVFTG